MKSMNSIKSIVLASAMIFPTIFAGNAFALPSCGSCVFGAQPASHTFVTSSTDCTSCHTPAAPAPVVTAPVVTDPVVTAPVVTDPVVTAPVVTDPVVTAPVMDPVQVATTAPVVTRDHSTRGSGGGQGMRGQSDDHRSQASTITSGNRNARSTSKRQGDDD